MANKDKKIRIDIELSKDEMKELKALADAQSRSKRWMARDLVLRGIKMANKVRTGD